MLVVWAIGSVVTYFMLPVDWFMETIGFLAVFTEAMLGELITFHRTSFVNWCSCLTLSTGAPQFLRNYKNKSTHGMSFLMVIMWMIGDVYKTTYFLLRSSPMQFWICGMLQVSQTLRSICHCRWLSDFCVLGFTRLSDSVSSLHLQKESSSAQHSSRRLTIHPQRYPTPKSTSTTPRIRHVVPSIIF